MKGQTHFRDIQGVGNEKDILCLKNVFMATYFLISECAGQKRQIRFRDTLFLILLPFCLLAALIEPLCVYLYCLSMRWWQELFVFPPRFARNCSIIKDMWSEKGDFDDDSRVGIDVNSYSIKIQCQHLTL